MLPNSHADWARVYKFEKFMKNNWVCLKNKQRCIFPIVIVFKRSQFPTIGKTQLTLTSLFNSGLDTSGNIGIHFDGFGNKMVCRSFQRFDKSFLEVFINILCNHLLLFQNILLLLLQTTQFTVCYQKTERRLREDSYPSKDCDVSMIQLGYFPFLLLTI